MKLAAALFLATAAVALADSVVTLTPTADAFVSSQNAGSNYGAAGALAVSAGSLPKGEFDSLLKFDLSSAKASFDATYGPNGWTIDSVTLQLTAATPNNAIFNGFVQGGTSSNAAGLFSITWLADDSWTEGTGMPKKPTTDGITYTGLQRLLTGATESLGTYSFPGGNSGNNTWPLGLTGGFSQDASAGNTVSLALTPADSGVIYTANSRDFGTVSAWPILTVSASAVPEPGAAPLLFFAGAILLARRSRHAPEA